MSFDSKAAVVAWLKQCAALTTLVGASNIYAGVLPEGFSCDDGRKAITVRNRGGTRHGEIPVLFEPSLVIQSFALEEPDAEAIYSAAEDWMHGKNNIDLGALGFIFISQKEVGGQDIVDRVTKWASVVGYFRIVARPQGS